MNFKLIDSGAFQTEVDYGKLPISGNSELGYRPFQLLVSSIVGCSGGVFKTILNKKRIAFDSIEIETDVERNPEEANKVTKIHLKFIVRGNDLNFDQVSKSLSLTMKNCAMVQSVKDSIDISEAVELHRN